MSFKKAKDLNIFFQRAKEERGKFSVYWLINIWKSIKILFDILIDFKICCDIFNNIKRDQDVSIFNLPVKRFETLLISRGYLLLTDELIRKAIKACKINRVPTTEALCNTMERQTTNVHVSKTCICLISISVSQHDMESEMSC